MRIAVPCFLAATLTTLTPLFAITLAPGQSGYVDFVSTADTGTTLAETSYSTTVFITDAGTPETFDSRVTRGTDGSVTFWYAATLSSPFGGIPQSVTLPGFAGLTTNIQQFNEDPFNPTLHLEIPGAGVASRSANGDSINIPFVLPIDPGGPDYTPMILLAVTTNATSFQLSDTGYQPTYLGYPYSPPGGPTEPFLSTQPRPAFIPAIPEPLSLLTLPLALAALSLRRRRFFA